MPKMTKDELYQQYEETLALIAKQAHEANEKARTALREQLKILRDEAHEELKAIRILEQKTKRSVIKCRMNE